MAQRPGPDPTVRPIEQRPMYHDIASAPLDFSSVANEEQYYTAATFEHDAEDARHPLPPLIGDPPLPSGPAPMITPEEAAAVTFANRRNLMGFLLYTIAFGAMIAAGR